MVDVDQAALPGYELCHGQLYVVSASVAVSGVADVSWQTTHSHVRLDHSESADVQDVSATSYNDPVLKSTNGDDRLLARKLSLKELLMQGSLSNEACGVQGHLTDVRRTITNVIKAEMQLYASTGNWGTRLEKVHAYLM